MDKKGVGGEEGHGGDEMMGHLPGEDEHVRSSLGLYALGALHGPERDAVEDHLLRCVPCRTECDELLEVSGMLALLTEAQVRDLTAPVGGTSTSTTDAHPVAGPRPDTSASGSASGAGRRPGGTGAAPGGRPGRGPGRTRRRPRLDSRARLTIVVAVCALLAGVGIGWWLPGPGAPVRTEHTLVASATDRSSGASLSVLVGTAADGSVIRATAAGLPAGVGYQLIAVTVDGGTHVVGQWVGTEVPQTVSGELAVHPETLAFFTVARTDGSALVSAQVNAGDRD